MGFCTPKTRTVSSRRKVETAVTASLCSIMKRVMGKNEGSCPTRVMSVPCRVVTTFSRSGPTICRAR